MLDEQLADKILQKVCGVADCAIVLTDENGMVVASHRKEQLGTYYQAAACLLDQERDLLIIERDDPLRGFVESVNTTIYEFEKKAGILSLIGNPHRLIDIAQGLRLTAETIIEYEGAMKRKTYTKSGFLDKLLFESPEEEERLRQIAQQLQLCEELIRVPVLIDMQTTKRQIKSFLRMFEENEFLDKQDLFTSNEDGQIILFKKTDASIKQFMQDYRYNLAGSMSKFLHYMRSIGVSYTLYTGPAQSCFHYYRQAYEFCMWMKHSIVGSGSYYFYDHVIRYLEREAPRHQMDAIFHAFIQKLSSKFIDQYVETMDALMKQNYNLAKTAKELHIHKNTLIYRLDKIRESFHMEPLNVNSDREFMECFYYYIRRSKRSILPPP